MFQAGFKVTIRLLVNKATFFKFFSIANTTLTTRVARNGCRRICLPNLPTSTSEQEGAEEEQPLLKEENSRQKKLMTQLVFLHLNFFSMTCFRVPSCKYIKVQIL